MTPQDTAARALALVDLTSLNDDDTPEVIEALCAQAVTPAGPVAAVCVYGRFAAQAVTALRDTPVRVATVANFPHGGDAVAPVREEAVQAVADGVDELDVVLPYRRYAAGDTAAALAVVEAAREATAGIGLKVILESGQLGDPDLVRRAAADALSAGADFVKTSTGKTSPGATLEAARPMLEAVQAAGHGGFKASGGIRTTADAAAYLALAEEILGPGWARPATMRFGASSLLGDLLETLGVVAQAGGDDGSGGGDGGAGGRDGGAGGDRAGGY